MGLLLRERSGRSSQSTCATCVCLLSVRAGARVALWPGNAPSKIVNDWCWLTALLKKLEALAHELGSYFSGPRVLGPEARLWDAVPWNEAALPLSRSNASISW